MFNSIKIITNDNIALSRVSSCVEARWHLMKRDIVVMKELKSTTSPIVIHLYQRSFVWKYFGFETDRNGHPLRVDTPKYRLCQATVAAKDSNTSNLYSHLQNKHPEEFVIAHQEKV